LLGGLAMLAPFLYILTTSLKDVGHIYSIPPQWIPWPPHFENYAMIFQVAPFQIYARNTALITIVYNIGELASCSIVAYGFARLRGKGRNLLFLILLATLMIPSQVSIIPTFVLFKYLHWYDRFYPLTAPAFFGNAFYIFLLRQYMMTLPLELDDAAKIGLALVNLPRKADRVLDRIERDGLVVRTPDMNRLVTRLERSASRLTAGIVFAALLSSGIQLYLSAHITFAIILLGVPVYWYWRRRR
jgi:hypothetical protein